VTARIANANFDHSTLTDEDGRWVLGGLPEGRYTLTIAKPAHVTAYYGSLRPGRGPGSPIAVADGAQMKDIVVRMQRGAVIAGTVSDEAGQPLPNAAIRVWQLLNSGGERRIVGVQGGFGPVNQLITDDLGGYRVFGLSEGTYYVSVSASGSLFATTFGANSDMRRQSAEDVRAIQDEASRPNSAQAAAGTAFQPMAGRAVGYAPIFHPSAVAVDSAAGIVLGPAMERAGVDIVARLVPTTVIRGRVIGPDGQPPAQVRVMAASYESGGIPIGGFSQTTVGMAPDGTFATPALAPGRYTLWARGAPAGQGPEAAAPGRSGAPASVPINSLPLFGDLNVEVTGDELPEVILTLLPGVSVRGKVVFEGDGAPPSLDSIRLGVSSVTPNRMASGGGSASPDGEGAFTLANVPPGEYRASAFLSLGVLTSNQPSRWAVKSVTYQGRDVLDASFEVRAGTDIEGLTATFTNHMPELTGTITDAAGRPQRDLTIVLFSARPSEWRSGSRRILAPVQPDNNGRFLFASVPPGDYYLAAIGSADRNDLADPSFLEAVVPAAVRVTIADGEKKVQDLRVAGGGK
jgi:protocatechuate 3,4-dioxygenase beta subunit